MTTKSPLPSIKDSNFWKSYGRSFNQ